MNKINTKDILHYHLMFRNIFKDLLRPDKTPVSEFEILLLVEENEGLKVGDLSEIMSITRPNLTPLVESLANNGFIARRKDESDKRVIRLYITEKGKEKVLSNLKVIEQRALKMKEKYSDEELALIKKHCEELEKIIKK